MIAVMAVMMIAVMAAVVMRRRCACTAATRKGRGGEKSCRANGCGGCKSTGEHSDPPFKSCI